jgi:hypothetical protein
MRIMLKAQPDIELGNQAVQDGSINQVVQQVSEIVNPEAFYVGPIEGRRTIFLVFEIDDSSKIVSITEPFFTKLNAKVELFPVMNRDEMMKGLAG